jgi:hypothetical protein
MTVLAVPDRGEGREVGGGGKADDAGVEKAAHPPVLQAARHEGGIHPALRHPLAEGGQDLVLAQGLPFQVLLDHGVVELGHRLDEGVAGRLRRHPVVPGNLLFLGRFVRVDERLHLEQVDQALEVRPLAHGKGEGDDLLG